MSDKESKLADDDEAPAKLKDIPEMIENCEYDSKINENLNDFICFSGSNHRSGFDFVCDIQTENIGTIVKLKKDSMTIKDRLSEHIVDKIDQGHIEINETKLFEHLISNSYDRQSAKETVDFLVDSFDGSIDTRDIKTYANDSLSPSKQSLAKLIDCPLLPGFLDSFLEEDPVVYYDLLWTKLYDFLNNHRLVAGLVNEPYVENRLTVCNLRTKILFELEKDINEHYLKTKNKSLCLNEDCYKSISVCCSRDKMQNLIDNKTYTFWQATHVEKCGNHCIHIDLKENISLISLSICTNGNRNDRDLKNLDIEVKVGNQQKDETTICKCDYIRTINKDYMLCSCFPTDQKFTYIKINIVHKTISNRLFKNGKALNNAIQINSIKLVGKNMSNIESNKNNVMNASICWYFEMVSSMVLMQSQLMPSAVDNILGMTKTALKSMPPLSILHEKHFLTPNLLEKADTFFKTFLALPTITPSQKSEAILIYLEFNLARGHLKSIINSLSTLLANIHLDYDFKDLKTRIQDASRLAFHEFSRWVAVKYIKTNENSNDNNNSEIVIDLSEENSQIILESSKSLTMSAYNLLLEVQSGKTITDINIKIKPDQTETEGGILIFTIRGEKPGFNDFDSFNDFNEDKYNSYKQSSTGKKSNFDVTFCNVSYNQVLIDVPLPISHLVKYVFVKFLRKRATSQSNSIVIKSLKVYGCAHHQFELYRDIKNMQVLRTTEDKNSIYSFINQVLWLLCQLAEQYKSNSKLNQDTSKFLIVDNFEIADLWDIYEKAIEINETNSPTDTQIELSNDFDLSIPILIIVYELINCDEKRNEKNRGPQLYQNIFENLCKIIDSKKKSSNSALIMTKITREILKNGVLVFFPNEVRKEVFMQMIENNIDRSHVLNPDTVESKTKTFSFDLESTYILFEAFCNLFCQNKTIYLRHLVKNIDTLFENWSDCTEALDLIEKLITFSFYLNATIKANDKPKENITLIKSLNDLINSIQSSIFFNLKQNLQQINEQSQSNTSDSKLRLQNNMNNFVLNLTTLMINKGGNLTKSLLEKRRSLDAMTNLKSVITFTESLKLKNFLNKIVYSFMLWLGQVYPDLDLSTCTELTEKLIGFHSSIVQIEKYVEDEKPIEEEKVLKTWVFNSRTKNSLSDLNIEYNYPTANRFLIEIDKESDFASASWFENSVDEKPIGFTDCRLVYHAIPVKNGTVLNKLDLISNTYIQFSFCLPEGIELSSFFLKFTVSAIGYDKLINKIVLNDLLESITCLIGSHLSRVYTKRFDKTEISKMNIAKQLESSTQIDSSTVLQTDPKKNPFLLYQAETIPRASNNNILETDHYLLNFNSEFYRIMFRGGIASNKNKRTNLKTDNNMKLLSFLNKLMNFYKSIDVEPEDTDVLEFLRLYDAKSFTSTKSALIYAKGKAGGIELSELILSIFCCLIWHQPSIKYDHIFKTSDSKAVPIRNEMITEAFKIAESTRMPIIEQQQLYKRTQVEESPALIDIISEKVKYLLQFNRLSERLLNYETKKTNRTASTGNETVFDKEVQPTNHKKRKHSSIISNIQSKQKQCSVYRKKLPILNRLPKCDGNQSVSMIFEFIFDNQVKSLDEIEKILAWKSLHALLIIRNFDLAIKFLENVTDSNIIDRRKVQRSLEFILTLLGSFFDDNSKKEHGLSPPALKFKIIHYLQNLYGCGLEMENLVRTSYYKFINLLFSVENKFHCYLLNDKVGNALLERLNMRMNCLILNFLNVQWEIYDWKFLSDCNLIGYLLKNSINSMPIRQYTNERNQTPTQVLEDVFKLSREDFNKNFGKDAQSENKVETNEQASSEPVNEEDSFDLKIFPKLYQSIFQENSKNFDTDSLLKFLSAEIKTYEQYEKFIVARYMFWKYFSKLKASFYCDSCDVILTENRYVCLECREYCLCFNCFSKSIIDNSKLKAYSNDMDKKLEKKKAKKKTGSQITHKVSHRMLLLDHMCNKCGSLVIGKRIHCEECDNYDLCLMCHKSFDEPAVGCIADHDMIGKHSKSHRIVIIEPTIQVAKSEKILDLQVYLYSHSKMLFTMLTLKLSNLLNSDSLEIDVVDDCDEIIDFYNKQDFSLDNVKKLHANCMRFILFLVNNLSRSNGSNIVSLDNSLDQKFMDNLKIFVAYNQENLIGLISSAVRISKNQLKSTEPYTFASRYLNETNVLEDFFNFNSKVDTCENNNRESQQINIYQLLEFFIKLIIKKDEYMIDETIVFMVINLLKILLVESNPNQVDLVVKNIIFDLKYKYDYLKQIDENDFDVKVKFSKELTLELLFNWIDQNIVESQLEVVTLFVSIIAALNAHLEWKPKVINFMDKILSSILESFNRDACVSTYSQSKLFNFLYALNFVPSSKGQWVEFKNPIKSNSDFKLYLLKSFYFFGFKFYLRLIDPESRRAMSFSDLKYNNDFRKADDLPTQNETNLKLNKKLIAKLIQLLKKLLTQLKLNNSDQEKLSITNIDTESSEIALKQDETSSSKNNVIGSMQSSGSLLKQKLVRYEIMHIDRKKETNSVFQQLQLKNNLLLLSVITLIKDFILKKNKDDELEISDDLLIDPEFVNWIAKLAFSNTNMNAHWKISHLRTYLVSLLLREGFMNSTKGNTEEGEPIAKSNNSEAINKSTTFTQNQKKTKTDVKKPEKNAEWNSLHGAKESSFHSDVKKQLSIRDIEHTVDDLKLNLSSYAVLGVCDVNSAKFTLNEMSTNTSTSDNIPRDPESSTSDLQEKRSLLLLEDCMDKLALSNQIIEKQANNSLNSSNLLDANKSLTKGESCTFGGKTPAWFTELQNCMSKYMQAHSGGCETKSKSIEVLAGTANPFKLATSKPANTVPIQPIENSIKIVSNAIIVLTSRELLILFVNWSLNQQKKSETTQICVAKPCSDHIKSEKKISIMQINCETEFELLQLLDILYYTDNSINYKLFIKNLIMTLHCADLKKQENSESLQVARNSSAQIRILQKIAIMACDFMLPEFKLLKKINWSSENTNSDEDSGKIKNKRINDPSYEEDITFILSGLTKKQAFETESGSNLSCKPNDIEKLSTLLDSTLLIVFDAKKSHKTNVANQFLENVSLTKANYNEKIYQTRLKNFLKHSNLVQPEIQKFNINAKYLTNDDYEKVDTKEKTEDKSLSDQESNCSSVDSINNETNAKYRNKLLKKRKDNSILDTFSDSDDEYKPSDERIHSFYDDCDDRTESHNKSKLKKIKEAGKKCRIFFQVVRKRRECNSNYDSGEDLDGNDSRYDDEDDDDEDDDYNDTNDSDCEDDSFSDDDSDRSLISNANDNIRYDGNWEMIGDDTFPPDSDEEKYRKSIYKLPLDYIEYNPYLAINNQKYLKWKFLRDESSSAIDACSFKIYSSFSKNFASAYFLLDELIDQLAIHKFQKLNEIWNYLIKISCAQVFGRRLKVFGILIKILNKVNENNMDKTSICLFSLKPLKNLQVMLETPNKEDRKLSRALFELFFYAEKLAIKWSIQHEYRARLKDREEIIEKLCETSHFINMILVSLNMKSNLGAICQGKNLNSNSKGNQNTCDIKCLSEPTTDESKNTSADEFYNASDQ